MVKGGGGGTSEVHAGNTEKILMFVHKHIGWDQDE
jgi:hypothetical protein